MLKPAASVRPGGYPDDDLLVDVLVREIACSFVRTALDERLANKNADAPGQGDVGANRNNKRMNNDAKHTPLSAQT
jgi:hypothetical protein